MNTLIRPALVVFGLLSILSGLLYPLALTGLAQALFPAEANGSLILRDGRPVASALIGQNFTSDRYFWGRPSATGPVPYNAGASSGSNLGPTNPALAEAVQGRVAALRAAHPAQRGAVPVDLVTTSASGLDPHLSPAATAYQIERVAGARQLPIDRVQALVASLTEGRQWGVFGEPRVNIVKLNVALDAHAAP